MTQQLILQSQTEVNLPQREVFALFGAEESSSWLFGARSDRIAEGATVRLRLPLEPHAQFSVELLGRYTLVRAPSVIVIEHHQPWRGRLRISFDALGPYRTRVRIRAGLDPAGVDWLVRRLGLVLPDPAPTESVRIGIMTSKSGPAAIYAIGVEHMAELAVEQINAEGGVKGRPVETMIVDDATDARQAGFEAGRLARAGCRAIFACTTSASFFAATAAVRDQDVLMVQPVINEGGMESETVVRFGERPHAQISALAEPLMAMAQGRRWFLVGQQYSWSYGAHGSARSVLAAKSGSVVGEYLTPLGTEDFTVAVEKIRASGAEVVMSSLIGSDEVAFQRQCAAAGLRQSSLMLSLVMDESTHAHIGEKDSDGIWTALGYFEDSGAPDNQPLVKEYRDRYGRWAPPVTALSETVYEAVLQYVRTLVLNPDGNAREHARALRDRRAGHDSVGSRDLLSQRLYLARSEVGKLHIFDRTD
ncbi:MAG: Extracellular ligand-binding receptor [Rhodococcus erythropolis]|nr:Extracellular ligand-binding receptor [Rhodococcus erythropolis]